MRDGPQLAVLVSGLHALFGPDLRSFVEVARIADEAGVDQVVLPDHVVMGARTDRYPYGTFPYDADAPWIEPLTTLAAMASATTRVRLGTGILIAPLRPAVLLAKTIATLDVLSGGRVDLGVGVGWQREEYEALGVPFAGRWQRLDDTLGACRALWQDAPASFSSPTVAFDDIWCAPRPVQARVPVWFGAKASEALAGRIAALGDGWYPLGNLSPDELREGGELMRDAFRAAGRDAAELGVRWQLAVRQDGSGRVDVARTMEPVPALVDAGVTVLSTGINPRIVQTMDDVRAYLDALVAAFAALT